MAEFVALPGTLNISLTTGDEFGMLADLDIDTTGFVWTAVIYEATTNVSFSNPGGANTVGYIFCGSSVSQVDALLLEHQ